VIRRSSSGRSTATSRCGRDVGAPPDGIPEEQLELAMGGGPRTLLRTQLGRLEEAASRFRERRTGRPATPSESVSGRTRRGIAAATRRSSPRSGRGAHHDSSAAPGVCWLGTRPGFIVLLRSPTKGGVGGGAYERAGSSFGADPQTGASCLSASSKSCRVAAASGDTKATSLPASKLAGVGRKERARFFRPAPPDSSYPEILPVFSSK
jgi:hypothetical protein